MLTALREIWNYRETLWVLVVRQLKVRYKGSLLGFFWSLVPPIALVFILVILLEQVIWRERNVQDLSAYMLCAMFAWYFFNAAVLDGSSCILEHAALVRAFPFPRDILPIATLLSNLIHFLLSLAIFMVYLQVLQVQLTAKVFLLPVIIVGQSLFTLGLLFFLSYLCVYYPDVKYLMESLIVRLMFFLCPIIYFAEQVPQHLQGWYLLNPLSAYFTAYRHIMLYGHPPNLGEAVALNQVSWGFYLFLTLVISLLVFLAGFLMFQRHKHRLVEWL